MMACPTSIDIPLFIREIAAGHPKSAAKTIFDQNIFGGMCARVCPTETLCEEVCVRMVAEGQAGEDRPAAALRHRCADGGAQLTPIRAAPATGKRVAVVGAGPAGLACAHRLAMHGHEVTVFEKRKKAGGLNEYGIAAYKTVDDFARTRSGFHPGHRRHQHRARQALGRKLKLKDLQRDYDAVFLGDRTCRASMRLAATTKRPTASRTPSGYIAELRQAEDLSSLPVGRRILVIGGGMTAIDVAVQSKLLGAEDVTILYRRGAGAR